MGSTVIGRRLLKAIEQSDLDEVVNILASVSLVPAEVRRLLTSEVSRPVNKSEIVEVPLMVASRLDCSTVFKFIVENYQVDVNYVYEYTVQVSVDDLLSSSALFS